MGTESTIIFYINATCASMFLVRGNKQKHQGMTDYLKKSNRFVSIKQHFPGLPDHLKSFQSQLKGLRLYLTNTGPFFLIV